MKLYFVTKNQNKVDELTDYLRLDSAASETIELCHAARDVQEILSPELEDVVRSKALEAYKLLQQPCIVEHGGLFFAGTREAFPGVFGRIIWRALEDRMCGFLREGESRAAAARACIGYCDGRRIRLFHGETTGEISLSARGDYGRNGWDPIFIPAGSTETYGEMGIEKKRASSPLLRAWTQFITEVGRPPASPRSRRR